MTLVDLASALAAYLLTYALHSTVALASVGLVLSKLPVPASAESRLRVWKLALLAPFLSALAVSLVNPPHFGLELALGDRAASSSQAVVRPAAEWRQSAAAEVSGIASLPTSEGGRRTERLTSASEPERRPAEALRAERGGAVIVLGRSLALGLVSLWLLVAAAGLLRLAYQWRQLARLRGSAVPIRSPRLLHTLRRVRESMGLRRDVELLASPRIGSPLTAGLSRPFILLPSDGRLRELRFSRGEYEAILAHELAHVRHRDAYWNLLIQIVCRVGIFQPLNGLAARQVRQQMDFVADATAVAALGESTSLASCLVRFAEGLSDSVRRPALAALVSEMAAFESTLGRRIERLLAEPDDASPRSPQGRVTWMAYGAIGMVTVSLLAPRAVSHVAMPPDHIPPHSSEPVRNEMMNRSLATLMMIGGLAVPATAQDAPSAPVVNAQATAAPLKTTPDELPEGIRGFNGMLVGRVAAKDAEQGTFTVQVDAVSRVWENSRAENPRSLVGKTVSIGGVFGRFLDVLIVTRIGETVEFECKYDEGRLVFPGELLRKVGPFEPEDYPILPEAFRGFKGLVAAEVLKKDPETLEVVLRVDQVRQVWDGNRAKDAKSIEGKPLVLAGFWNRRDAFHELKVGGKVELGMNHNTPRSDHLTVSETIRAIREPEPRTEGGAMRKTAGAATSDVADAGRGFRGMLVGRLVEKDAERGTFTVAVDAVPRVWENNQLQNPKSLIGQTVTIEGVSGRLIDTLVVARRGETLEFGAIDQGGSHIRVGEVLHKVAPVQPGDYPVLPDGFRGFRGIATAKILRKSDELSELIVEVTGVGETFAENQAEDPSSIVGKRLMLAGFWNRKDEYHDLKVGDTIRCGMAHAQLLSDHLNVVESVRVIDAK